MIDNYKISAEEFAKTSFSRLATRPNSRTANGEGQMSAEELKKRFDKQGELFRAKFNAFLSLIGRVGEGESLADFMYTGIAEDHTLKALFEDIVSESGRFASYLSVGDQSLLEKLIAIGEELIAINESQEKLAEEVETQKDALEGYVKRIKTSQQSVYTTDTDQASSGNPVPIYESPTPSSIPKRGAGGRLKVGGPVDPADAVNKEVFDRSLADKVDRVTLTGKNLAYGVSTEGEQRTFPMTAESWTYSIAMRNNQRTFDIGEPKAGTHPVNRAYLERILEAFVAKQGDQVIEGDLSVSGDLYVTGSTYGTDVESLNVKDAVIVANADGVPLAELSGYVIRVSDSQAYGILYDPVEDCVKIGLGTFDGKVFVYGANEAQVLATRDVIEHGNVPVWNGEKNTFEDSGKQAEDLATKQYIDELYGDIDGALSAILEEQKSILAIQDALIGGGV